MAWKGRPYPMSVFVVAALIYVCWATFLFFMQRRMMFPGADLAQYGLTSAPAEVESIRLPFSGGSVEAWFVPAAAPHPSPAAVFAHGNAELITNGLPDARSLAGLGVSVLLVEYPGYGGSDGRASRQSIGEVFLTAYDWLAARPDVNEEDIIGVGRSLGTGIITDLARHRPLRALVLQSAYTSTATFAKRYLLPGFLVRDRFDNLEVLEEYSGPVLLIHGRQDPVIPYSHGERLAAASESTELISLDCGHNDCPPDWAAYESALQNFLVRAGVLLPGPQPPASR